ncbi:GNAT family N-acetyltransferase [Halalkalibacillus sediminis]|uniref:GNAT family N-acetyltransferase n=1 Tax=Halalkalibacillus sediminis TaxID=2018042 RepID=A0A2I0QWQ8_9BACI|nr:GNAT family N-acetyltransferase [Halalkalibacillus sediminis]PKR78755.1 GNAT family N-acetyltransferase [Halalkalibacillus sediminis]
MTEIKQVLNQEEKSRVTNYILRQLPEWFGIEEAIVNYVNNVVNTEFYVYNISEQPVGLIGVQSNNKYTSEVYVMAILKEYQNRGIGKELLDSVEDDLKNKNIKFLMVKTLGDSHPDKYYKNTREFYFKTGFYPLEEIKEIWGKENPCLIMAKNL